MGILYPPQATLTVITKEKMMFYGFPALSVAVVCAFYLLGVVAGDDDTVPQVWDSGWSCDRIGSIVEEAKQWNICEFILKYDLIILLEDANFSCPDDRVIGDLKTLIKDAAICDFFKTCTTLRL